MLYIIYSCVNLHYWTHWSLCEIACWYRSISVLLLSVYPVRPLVKLEFHGTDTDTVTDTDIRDAPIV